jgi:hypothetical protein
MKNGKILGEAKKDRFYEEIEKSRKYEIKNRGLFSFQIMIECLEKK